MMSLRETLRELDATPDDEVRLEFPVRAGFLARRRVRWVLDAWDFELDRAKVSYVEGRTLLGSEFLVRYEGLARHAAGMIRTLLP